MSGIRRGGLNFFVHKDSAQCKLSYENEPQKPQNIKEMLRKSPAWNGWTAILKNTEFS